MGHKIFYLVDEIHYLGLPLSKYRLIFIQGSRLKIQFKNESHVFLLLFFSVLFSSSLNGYYFKFLKIQVNQDPSPLIELFGSKIPLCEYWIKPTNQNFCYQFVKGVTWDFREIVIWNHTIHTTAFVTPIPCSQLSIVWRGLMYATLPVLVMTYKLFSIYLQQQTLDVCTDPNPNQTKTRWIGRPDF